jgi:branched-chain amino acid transport system substrate-binding protein
LQVVDLNQGALPVVAGDDVYSSKTLEIGQANAQGMVVAVPWHIEGQPEASFPQRSRQLWGGDVSWRTAMAYDATEAIAAALKQAPNPTRQGLRDALAATNFSAEGAAGPVRFQPSGDRNANIQLVTVKPGSRSGRGFDFVPLR